LFEYLPLGRRNRSGAGGTIGRPWRQATEPGDATIATYRPWSVHLGGALLWWGEFIPSGRFCLENPTTCWLPQEEPTCSPLPCHGTLYSGDAELHWCVVLRYIAVTIVIHWCTFILAVAVVHSSSTVNCSVLVHSLFVVWLPPANYDYLRLIICRYTAPLICFVAETNAVCSDITVCVILTVWHYSTRVFYLLYYSLLASWCCSLLSLYPITFCSRLWLACQWLK
jgi:hypothetical protein